MTSLACWNVRGLNQTYKQREIRVFIWEKRIALCALLETRVARHNVNRIFDRIFKNWQWVSNSDQGTHGCRICIGWNPAVYNVSIKGMNDQVIHTSVTVLSNGEVFQCSFIYASNEYMRC